MSKIILLSTLALSSFQLASAATMTLNPIDSVLVSDLTTTTTLNTVTPGLSSPYEARERSNTGQNNRQVATFLMYDVSTLTVADVSAPGFSVQFVIDFTGSLNDVNNGASAYVGRNDSGAWDSAGNNYPLKDWGWDDENDVVNAEDVSLLVANLQNYNDGSPAPGVGIPIADVTVDMTSVVQGWVNTPSSNQGLVLFIDDNIAQSAGFENAELVVACPIPEPSSIMLAGLALFGGLTRRRR